MVKRKIKQTHLRVIMPTNEGKLRASVTDLVEIRANLNKLKKN